MKNVITEKSETIQNNFSILSNAYFCHHCCNKIINQQQLTCSNKYCSNIYCISCLIKFYQKNPSFIISVQKTISQNIWKCPSCEGKCMCTKCKSRHPSTIAETEEQNKNNNYCGKKYLSDAELIMWLSTGEDTSIDTQNVKFPFVPLNSKIKSKVFDKLIKIAKQCELFYRHKCKNEYIKKNCSNCFETNFHQNDLLRFFNYETFLYYMKYLFYVSNKIVGYSKENFNRNKNDFEELFKRFKDKQEIWLFKDTKILCKQCMYYLINKPNFFENIKGIFLRQERKICLINNNIELYENEEKNKNNYINIDSKDNCNIKCKNKTIDAIIISKKIFNIEKKSKYNDVLQNDNNITNKQNTPNNNNIINYNNHNNNIFNTLFLNNEYKFNNTPIFGINILGNSFQNQNPFNINYLNDLQMINSINSKYIQSLFLGLEKEMTDILKIVDLSKKNYNKINYVSQTCILNQRIINYFKIIENCVISNLKFLNNINIKYNINFNMNNNNVFIEINQEVNKLIEDNNRFFPLLNLLKLNYLNIENDFIKKLFQ